MTNRFTHVVTPDSPKLGIGFGFTRTLCGARTKAMGALEPEALSMLQQYAWLKPLCPKCAALLVIEDSKTTTTEG
jgi:hypothetical protein